MSLLVFALALAAQPPLAVEVQGDVHDALFADEGLFLSRTKQGERELVHIGAEGREGKIVVVPRGAVSVDACPGRGLLFSDSAGVLDEQGGRLLEGAPLLAVPDPEALFSAPLCGRSGDARGEVRIAVHDGIAVLGLDGRRTTLPFAHRARAYSGQVHKGLRPSKPYALALSLYAPHLVDADVDGDGRLDLVAVHEGRVGVFLRDGTGALTPRVAVVRDLGERLGAGDDDDVRVLAGDLDGDKRADLVLSVTEGAVPERSSAYLLDGKAALARGAPRVLWRREGLSAPVGLVEHGGRAALVVTELDTSMVALGAALFTSEVPVKVLLHGASSRAPTAALALVAQLDVRGGRMKGAMPVVTVDFDGDGRADLLDLGRPGRAALHPGSASGFLDEPVREHAIAPFVHVVAMPALPGVVLIGEARDGRTRVTVLRGDEGLRARREGRR